MGCPILIYWMFYSVSNEVKKQSVTWESKPFSIEKNFRCHLAAWCYTDLQFQDAGKILRVL